VSVLLVLGGARSGKSRHAQQWIEQKEGSLAYIATGEARDHEMAERIARHRQERGGRWQTIEAPLAVPQAIDAASKTHVAILVDCLTLWVSNLLLAERDIEMETGELAASLAGCGVPVALVTNEVGLGIVPDNALARRFRDEAGRCNQRLAALADEVAFIAAGLAIRLK
jgi:adenosylcobinamide kinase/adenosylcobinamide-phosphate guanylyltransferase